MATRSRALHRLLLRPIFSLILIFVFFTAVLHYFIEPSNEDLSITTEEPSATAEEPGIDNDVYDNPPTFDACDVGCSDNDEKFITYLPHSQFNNQRIELENAILVAYFTNRTLIVPPLVLGHISAWSTFDKLYSFLSVRLHKNNCDPNDLDTRRRGMHRTPHCSTWTMLNWQEVYNLTAIQQEERIRMITAPTFKVEWIKKSLKLTDDDIKYFKDDTLYSMMVYDDPQSITPLGKYQQRADISDFKSIPQKLIYFNSLFGGSRVLTELEEHQNFRRRILRHFVFIYPKVMSTANKIIAALGGAKSYIGIHVRVSDGPFKRGAPQIVESIVRNLSNLNSTFDEAGSLRSRKCQHDSGPINDKVIYMATDIANSRRTKEYDLLYKNFPCILTLSDFDPLLEDLTSIVNKWDNMKMYKFLLPFVDVIVSAKGGAFVGTSHSTFTRYARQLNKMFLLDEIK
ncbi:5596_t:CDS:1 [Paraglomus occultum]|uniref:5596_t:CDS:1 n=1 Tax=Paraglomus occultum TaxID=144539 RepID=A0A9N9ABS1_9GLOM|nr:5596_t:CDS:1 [Paraglomus occultum]